MLMQTDREIDRQADTQTNRGTCIKQTYKGMQNDKTKINTKEKQSKQSIQPNKTDLVGCFTLYFLFVVLNRLNNTLMEYTCSASITYRLLHLKFLTIISSDGLSMSNKYAG